MEYVGLKIFSLYQRNKCIKPLVEITSQAWTVELHSQVNLINYTQMPIHNEFYLSREFNIKRANAELETFTTLKYIHHLKYI